LQSKKRGLDKRSSAMMKVTHVAEDEESVTLKIEGRIAGEWIDVLKEECLLYLEKKARLMLDFSEVSYIDDSGVKALKAMDRKRISLIGASLFLSGLLEGS